MKIFPYRYFKFFILSNIFMFVLLFGLMSFAFIDVVVLVLSKTMSFYWITYIIPLFDTILFEPNLWREGT